MPVPLLFQARRWESFPRAEPILVGTFPTVKQRAMLNAYRPTGGRRREPEGSGVDRALKNAVRAIFAPIVHYLIRRGITYPAVTEMLKEVYIRAAEQSDSAEQETLSDSRVSLLTGIHRKDVKRLRRPVHAGGRGQILRPGANLAARTVAAWVSTPRFLDRNGQPLELPRRSTSRRPSFETLVQGIRADVRAGVILEDLVRVGVATVEDGHVRLLKHAYVSALPEDKLAYLGTNVGDHLRSALHNIDGSGVPFLERAVYYDAIADQELEAARPALTQLAETFLRDANQRLMPLSEAAPAGPFPGSRRMRFGVYYYEEPTPTGARARSPDPDHHE